MSPGLTVMLECYRAGAEVWPDPTKPGKVLLRPVDRMKPGLAKRIRQNKQNIDRVIPMGWSRVSWTGRLRALADRCADLNPVRADELRVWADAISNNPEPY